jgi:predicted GH43/DUF377 family glycosyl hydrolase
MTPLVPIRLDLQLTPDSTRVIIRPFIPLEEHRITTIIGRALALTEEEATRQLQAIRAEFEERHFHVGDVFLRHWLKVQHNVFTGRTLSLDRKMLIGALFSGEYALESAALFNPSIVPHPDQSHTGQGALRFIMSLRATGEGHISSIEFRSGTIHADGTIAMDPVSRFLSVPEVLPNPAYRKQRFLAKLTEMGAETECIKRVLELLPERFTLEELNRSIETVRTAQVPENLALTRTLERIRWVADSNYGLRFPQSLKLSERLIFPVSANESNGIEDARFVQFRDDDGSAIYYATYTAYNGRSILPQMIETHDFSDFRMLTLDGKAALNKGMALFPRKVQGQYLMLSRQDDENLYLMRSRDPHRWEQADLLMRPAEHWEMVKIGNCGSPIETPAGWLVITHGVGPMRKYCIGAALLDLENPLRVIGRLRTPLLEPEGNRREGYVPNVVYSCGSLVHAGRLILPYGMSDTASAVASFALDDILAALTDSH